MARSFTRFNFGSSRLNPGNRGPTWVTRGGEKILITDMTLNHLINTIKMLERKAEEKRQGGLFEKGKNVPTEVMFPIVRDLKEEYAVRMKRRNLPVDGEFKLAKPPASPGDGDRRHRDVELD